MVVSRTEGYFQQGFWDCKIYTYLPICYLMAFNHYSFLKCFLLLILQREKREREKKNIEFLLHLFLHSLVNSCTYPDQGSNLQPWSFGMMLQPTELPGQGSPLSFTVPACVLNSKTSFPDKRSLSQNTIF